MKIVDLHTCGCPIGHADLFPTWSLKPKFLLFLMSAFFKLSFHLYRREQIYMQLQILKFHLWVHSGHHLYVDLT